MGDVHLALLLQNILGGTEVLRFVDVAAPIKDYNNKTVGVLGSHLSWAWAKELADSVINVCMSIFTRAFINERDTVANLY